MRSNWIRRARPKACRRRIYATALRSNPFQDSSEGESPPGPELPVRRRAFKMASGMEVLHGSSKKSILGPLLASLGEPSWCMFGHLGWPVVALEGLWLLTLCLFGLCFARPRFLDPPRANK